MQIVLLFTVWASVVGYGASIEQEIVTELLSDDDLMRELNGRSNNSDAENAKANSTVEDTTVQTVLPSESYDFNAFLNKIGFPGVRRHSAKTAPTADKRTPRLRRFAKIHHHHDRKHHHDHRHHHLKRIDLEIDRNEIQGSKKKQLGTERTTPKFENAGNTTVADSSASSDYLSAQTEVPDLKTAESKFVNVPKDLYQNQLTPGVIFRVHLTEAILKMQYRQYAEDMDSSVIDADSEYLRLARKLLADELDNFQQLAWLMDTFVHREESLVTGHTCGADYFVLGVPFTNFSTPEENLKRWCVFDSVFLDRVAYVIGADSSLMAGVAPPVLQCDASSCSTVPFVDSIMFEERLQATRVRLLTKCQAACRSRCTNQVGCLESCNHYCDADIV